MRGEVRTGVRYRLLGARLPGEGVQEGKTGGVLPAMCCRFIKRRNNNMGSVTAEIREAKNGYILSLSTSGLDKVMVQEQSIHTDLESLWLELGNRLSEIYEVPNTQPKTLESTR
jgi:hypothetical protein